MKKIVFMIARQRSGTNALNSILDQHEDICCTWEIFHPNGKQKKELNFYSFLNLYSDSYTKIATNLCTIFDEYIKNICATLKQNVIIFDVKYNSLNNINSVWYSHFHEIPTLINYIINHNYCILHLTRKNYLNQYISHIRANLTEEYVHKNHNLNDDIQFRINLNDLQYFIKASMAEDLFYKNLLANYKNYCQLDYYELFHDDCLSKYCLDILHNFLQVNGLDNIKAKYKKIIKDKADCVKNINEVRQFCKKNNFEYFLMS